MVVKFSWNIYINIFVCGRGPKCSKIASHHFSPVPNGECTDMLTRARVIHLWRLFTTCAALTNIPLNKLFVEKLPFFGKSHQSIDLLKFKYHFIHILSNRKFSCLFKWLFSVEGFQPSTATFEPFGPLSNTVNTNPKYPSNP